MPVDFAPHTMSSNTAPSPYVASASSEFSSSFAAWKAFQGGIGSGEYWIGNSAVEWLKLDLGSGNAETMGSYDVQMNNLGEGSRAPKAWTMEGSNDNSSWDTLDTVSAQTGWANGETRSFTCDVATAAYRYFRINITENNGDSLTQIGELYFYAPAAPAGGLMRIDRMTGGMRDLTGGIYG